MAESFASNSLFGLKTRTGRCCGDLAKVLAGEMRTDLKDEKLQLGNVVWMNPVLRGLSYEITLAATSRAITFDGVASRPNDIKQPRELNNIRIVIVLKERAFLQPRSKGRLENPSSFFLKSLASPPSGSGRLTSCFLIIFWNPV